MSKYIYLFFIVFLLTFSLLTLTIFSNSYAQAAPNYNFEIVEKSPDASIIAGDTVILWVKIKNTGSASWQGSGDNAIHLGTTSPQDRTSLFYMPSNWITPNRTHWTAFGDYNTGNIAEFGFIAKAQYDLYPGVYRECFSPVVENITWMDNSPMCWNITVNKNHANDYMAEAVDGKRYYELNLNPGETYHLTFQAKNIGAETWYKHSTTPIHLATTHPIDRSSEIYHLSWLSSNRPAVISEDIVAPGEIGTFQTTIQVPINGDGNQQFVEHFWLVAENKSWFVDPNPYGPVFAVVVKTQYAMTGKYSEKNSDLFINKNNIISDGKDVATVTIRLRDDQNQAIKYEKVNLNMSQFDRDTMKYFATTYLLETDSRGEAFKEFKTTANLDYSFNFKYQTHAEYPDWIYLTARKNSFDGVFDPQKSSFITDKKTAKSTGYDYAHLTITIKDKNSNPLVGQKVKVTSNNCLLTDGDWHDCWKEDDQYFTTDSNGNAYFQINGYIESVQQFSASIDNKYLLQTPIVEFKDDYDDNQDFTTKINVKTKSIFAQWPGSNSKVSDIVNQVEKNVYTNLTFKNNSWGVYSLTPEYESQYDSLEIVFDPYTAWVFDRPFGLENQIHKSKEQINRVLILFNNNDTAAYYFDWTGTYDDPDYDKETPDQRRWSYVYGGDIPSSEILKLIDKL